MLGGQQITCLHSHPAQHTCHLSVIQPVRLPARKKLRYQDTSQYLEGYYKKRFRPNAIGKKKSLLFLMDKGKMGKLPWTEIKCVILFPHSIY